MNLKLFGATTFFVNQALAWWGTGHLLTARIAYDHLIATDH
jgi:hypothetical protein